MHWDLQSMRSVHWLGLKWQTRKDRVPFFFLPPSETALALVLRVAFSLGIVDANAAPLSANAPIAIQSAVEEAVCSSQMGWR